MAITKERKREILTEYANWMNKSRALILAEYKGLSMSDMETLRNRAREAGGEFHVVKNTLGELAFREAGLEIPKDYFEGSTAIGFAFEDAPALAKMLTEYTRTSEFLKIKGGILDNRLMNADEIKALADLPPLPVMRARLLGVIQAPAAQLVRTLAEPARRVAAVLKAYADQGTTPEPAQSEAA